MSNSEKHNSTVQVFRVFIKATPQAIWDAITKPEWVERYGYACKAEFDVRPGGAYRARDRSHAGVRCSQGNHRR